MGCITIKGLKVADNGMAGIIVWTSDYSP